MPFIETLHELLEELRRCALRGAVGEVEAGICQTACKSAIVTRDRSLKEEYAQLLDAVLPLETLAILNSLLALFEVVLGRGACFRVLALCRCRSKIR